LPNIESIQPGLQSGICVQEKEPNANRDDSSVLGAGWHGHEIRLHATQRDPRDC